MWQLLPQRSVLQFSAQRSLTDIHSLLVEAGSYLLVSRICLRTNEREAERKKGRAKQ